MMIEIVNIPIDIQRVLESVRDSAAGAIDVFIGTTRDHADGKKVLALEYEAYESMALRSMTRIAEEAQSRWNVKKISIVHRIGKVDIGEASIVIAVSSVHRHEAFEACRFIINSIKKTVPLWKKEFFIDGESWVGLGEKKNLL